MNDTSTALSETRLVLRRTFAAPIARVYDAWTNLEPLRAWFCPPEVTVEIRAFDFRVGGAYRMEMSHGEHAEAPPFVVSGVYREIVARERLAFTWRWEEDRPEDEFDTLVTVEFHDRGASTELVLTHERLASDESRANHERGWNGTLDKLASYLST